MKSIFDPSIRGELVNRMNSLEQQNNAQWGKMNGYQMLKHCTLCEEMFLGQLKIKRVLLGRLIGKFLLKNALKENKPFDKNAPTSPLLKATSENGDIDLQKKEWAKRLELYANYDNPNFIHPFFGPMTKEQVGIFAYKHADHHLRQFGV